MLEHAYAAQLPELLSPPVSTPPEPSSQRFVAHSRREVVNKLGPALKSGRVAVTNSKKKRKI